MAGASQLLTLDDLRDQAATFAKADWRANSGNMGQITWMEMNPGLVNGCPALRNYCEGYTLLQPHVDVGSLTFFAWHGTATLQNIASICHYGFSPAKRKRQLHGPGEYFGVKPEDSHNYSANTDRLILVQIIRSNLVCTQNNCHIVNNPTNYNYCFTLPLLVVAYNNTVPLAVPWLVQPGQYSIPSPFTAGQLSPQAGGNGPHKWHWVDNGNSTEPYNTHIDATLEHHYQNYFNGGPFAFMIGPLKRLSDGTGQYYFINFTNMTQENVSSGFLRHIKREPQVIPNPTSKPCWYWMEEGNVWMPFPTAMNAAIELMYITSNGKTRISLPGITRDKDKTRQDYVIDLQSMIQTNTTTGYKRKVWRNAPGQGSAQNPPRHGQTVQTSPASSAGPTISQQPRPAQPSPSVMSINASATAATPLLGNHKEEPGIRFVRKWLCCS